MNKIEKSIAGKLSEKTFKLSFRKDKQPTGLWSVGHPNPITDIKINQRVVGYISPPTWDKNEKWTIHFSVKRTPTEDKPAPFKWVRLIGDHETEPEAREFVKEKFQRILNLDLYVLDENKGFDDD